VQGLNIKKAISVGLDNILLDENIESLPQYDDFFKISFVDMQSMTRK